MAGQPRNTSTNRCWSRTIKSTVTALTFCTISIAQASEPAIVTDRTRFEIPFDFDATRLAAVGAETVELYVARDGGSWQLSKTTSPSNRSFLYEAAAEGTYDFCVRARKQDGGRIPDAPLESSLRVAVDKTAPNLKLRAETSGTSSIQIAWTADDANLDVESLDVETRIADGDWKILPVQPSQSGAVIVSTASADEIRFRIKDLAGNASEQTAPLPKVKSMMVVAPGEPAPSSPQLASANAPASLEPTVVAASAIANEPATIEQLSAPSTQPAAPLASIEPTIQPATEPIQPALEPQPSTASESKPTEQWQQLHVAIDSSQPEPVATPEPAPTAPIVAASLPAPAPVQPAPQPVAEPIQTAMSPGHAVAPEATQPWTPSVTKRVNTRTFRLGYELEDVGPSGLSSVALYITENDGASWFHYGNDPDTNSPMDVTVPRDGIFGFTFRVMSGTGFGDLPPQPGERAEVTISVDQTPPTIQMLPLGHRHGAEGHQLAVRWNGYDAKLPPRPIRIEYAPTPSGNWTPIAPPQANSGEFVWNVRQPMPGPVYLRVSITDAAGNTSSDFTREPIMLDFSRPAARITAIEAITQ